VKIGQLFQKLKEGKQTVWRSDKRSFFPQEGSLGEHYLRTETESNVNRRFCSFDDDQNKTNHYKKKTPWLWSASELSTESLGTSFKIPGF
jgi:hypothetical protein